MLRKQQNKYYWFQFIFITIFAGLLAGCGRGTQKDVRQIQTEHICRCILEDPRCSQKSKELAGKALKIWADPAMDSTPILMHVTYHHAPEDQRQLRLYLTMSDKAFDIQGFIVREMDDYGNIIIEEKYPVFFWRNAGSFRLVKFKERKPGDKKDVLAWDKFQSDPNMDAGYLRKGDHPPVYVSIPQKNGPQVFMAIYDKNGSQSEFVPFDSFLYIRFLDSDRENCLNCKN
jgi:hypothetical protein